MQNKYWSALPLPLSVFFFFFFFCLSNFFWKVGPPPPPPWRKFLDPRLLCRYNFFYKPKWQRMNFYNYSVLPSSPFSVNGSPTLIEGGQGMVGLFPPTPLSPSFLLGAARASRAQIFRNFPSRSIFPRSPYSCPPLRTRGLSRECVLRIPSLS